MKKGVVFLLAILYITLTSGVVVNIHYCMGRLADVTYGHEKDRECNKCGMEQKNGCCKTTHKLVKADSDHLLSKSVNAPILFTADVPVSYDHSDVVIISREHFNSQYHSPPDQRSNHLHMYNSVFRI